MRAVSCRAPRFGGRVVVPGDKSIGHRAVLLAAAAKGLTRIEGLPGGADVRSSIACIERLGVVIRREADALVVESPGRAGWRRGAVELDAGNSGTTARLMAGLLAPVEGLRATLVGDASLSMRPMRRVSGPLASMGAWMEPGPAGGLPMVVDGRRLEGRNHVLDVASAQVKSALLLAGLDADGETWVREPAPSRDHTERMLPLFGAAVRQGTAGVGVVRTSLVAPLSPVVVPGDVSSAAFFGVAAAITGGEVVIDGVGLNPTRTGVFDVLASMGVCIETVCEADAGEPRGSVRVSGRAVRGVDVRGAMVPRLVDELPVLAVAAALCAGTSTFRDAGELRVKESDRIRRVVDGLRAMGAEVEEFPDGFAVDGGRPLRGARIDAAGDHRIAMAFSVAGLAASGETVVEGAEWAAISYPGFHETLAALSAGSVRVEG
jgi:3-phosphoshikimate 1-carboxyvinyltransferase